MRTVLMKHLKHAEFESCKNDQSEQSICQIDQSQVLEVVNPKWYRSSNGNGHGQMNICRCRIIQCNYYTIAIAWNHFHMSLHYNMWQKAFKVLETLDKRQN